MKVVSIKLFVLLAIFYTAPVMAMDWCALPKIIPRSDADFDRLAPNVEKLTGCTKDVADSAHHFRWECSDDAQPEEKYDGVSIHFLRKPGQGSRIVIVAYNFKNLDILRNCKRTWLDSNGADNPISTPLRRLDADIQSDTDFEPGNVALRERIRFGSRGPRLTLTSIFSSGISILVSDGGGFGDDIYLRDLWKSLYGIDVERYPTTGVLLAGKSPISEQVSVIVSAFEARGSQIKQSQNVGGTFPSWSLSPPLGLAGVSEVAVHGFNRHLLRAEYVLTSTPDYERYIILLDSEYGESRRIVQSGCTYRWWQSGNVSIHGQHCTGKSDKITFWNDVIVKQMQQISAKLEAESKESDSGIARPTIDTDMF